VPRTSATDVAATKRASLEARVQELLHGIATGDESASRELHAYCRTVPALWNCLGSLEESAIENWKQLLAPEATDHGALMRDRIEAELAAQRNTLQGNCASPLEALLVNRILSAWLQVMFAETAYAQMQQWSCTDLQLEYAQKRLDRALRQYLRAIQALATVRRLLRPTQVNIGQNQINVSG
jgi:hypothetical protein